MRPPHTSKAAPATVAVAILLPTGWIGPRWLSHTMISTPLFCPVVLAAGSNQMSYAASQAPPLG